MAAAMVAGGNIGLSASCDGRGERGRLLLNGRTVMSLLIALVMMGLGISRAATEKPRVTAPWAGRIYGWLKKR